MIQTANAPRQQLWATFSVKDHCRRGAFIAEALLYDKLLIPVLPTEQDGLSPEQALDERERWKKEDWRPARQTEIVGVLGDRAEPIPWTAERQDEWRSEMQKSFADARRDGYFESGTVLQKFAPAMARTVVAVAPVYSLQALKKEAAVRRVAPRAKVPGNTLMAVLGQELLVPSLRDGGYLKALAAAVDVARTDEYRAARQALYDWQQKFLADPLTDAASIEAAVEEMRGLMAKVRTARKEQAHWRGLKQFFSFFGAGFKLAALSTPVTAAAGGAFASLGSFAVDAKTPAAYPDDPGIPAAMMILGARERLGVE